MAHEPTRHEIDETPTPLAQGSGWQPSGSECDSPTHPRTSLDKRPHQRGG